MAKMVDSEVVFALILVKIAVFAVFSGISDISGQNG